MKLQIKYCGGCNPVIDRKKVVNEVLDILSLSMDVELVKTGADFILVVCGCSAACVDLDVLKDQSRELILVGGNVVDCYHVPSDKLAAYISNKILDKVKKEEKVNNVKMAGLLQQSNNNSKRSSKIY